MTAGLGLLRLEPRAFWAMTPRELSAALRAVVGAGPAHDPPHRRDLAALMARFPDPSPTVPDLEASRHTKREAT